MKKFVVPVVALAAVIVVAIALLPLLISGDMVRTGLLDRAREITGREMQFAGNPKVLFWPFLGIEISDVSFRDDIAADNSAPILSMPKLKGRLSVASALQGKVSFSEFQFIRPKFNLKIYSTGQTNWSFPDGKVWEVLENAKTIRDATNPESPIDISGLDNIQLGKFVIENGIVDFENQITASVENITDLDGTLDWPTTRSGWQFRGNGIWRGDELSLSTSAQIPIMLIAGGTSPITLDIDSDPFKLHFEGSANRYSGLFVSGAMELSTQSFRRFANLFGGELDTGSSLAEFSAAGKVSATQEQIEISDGKFNLDGNGAGGTLRLARGEMGKVRVSGTLAYDKFDFAPYAADAEIADKGDTGASLIEFASRIETDLRYSASTASIGNLTVSNLAGGIISRDGKLMFDIGNANLGDGMLVAKFEATQAANALLLDGNLSLNSVNLAKFPALRTISRIYTDGPSNLRAKLSARGNRVKELIRNLSGTVSIKMPEGQLVGLDYAGIIENLEAGDTDAAGSAFADTRAVTRVSALDITANVNRGVAWIRKSGFRVGDRAASLMGKVDLTLGSMALWSYVAKEDDTANAEDIPRGLPDDPNRRFFLGGTLSQPLFLPEIQEGTIRESIETEAAAPSPQPAVNN